MAIKLKRTKKVSNDYAEVLTSVAKIKARIELLNRLKDSEISDDEYLKIIAQNYTYNPIDFADDLEKHQNLIFGSEFKSKVGIETTDIEFSSKTEYHFNFRAFIAEPEANLTTQIWHFADVLDLIKNRKAIVELVLGADKIVKGEKKPLTPKENEFFEKISIYKLSLSDLGIYKDWFLPIIKSIFTEERIAADILTLINDSRSLIDPLIAKLNGEIKDRVENIATMNALATEIAVLNPSSESRH